MAIVTTIIKILELPSILTALKCAARSIKTQVRECYCYSQGLIAVYCTEWNVFALTDSWYCETVAGWLRHQHVSHTAFPAAQGHWPLIHGTYWDGQGQYLLAATLMLDRYPVAIPSFLESQSKSIAAIEPSWLAALMSVNGDSWAGWGSCIKVITSTNL